MKQSMLSILCHIIHGEKLLENGNKPGGVSSAGLNRAQGGQGVNEDHLRQLMDMGFSREHARTALLSTATLEQATEYALIRAPPPPLQGSQVS